MEPVEGVSWRCLNCHDTRLVTIRREDGYHVYIRCPVCTLNNFRREVPR